MLELPSHRRGSPCRTTHSPQCAAHRAHSAHTVYGDNPAGNVITENSGPPKSAAKIMCMAYTYEGHHKTQAMAAATTWMGRCDGALVSSNATDADIPTTVIAHTGDESYANLWQKTRANFFHLHQSAPPPPPLPRHH